VRPTYLMLLGSLDVTSVVYEVLMT